MVLRKTGGQAVLIGSMFILVVLLCQESSICAETIDYLEIVSSFDAPDPHPRGLAWDGTDIWVATGERVTGVPVWDDEVILERIYTIDDIGNVVSYFGTDCHYPAGMAWDGENLRYVALAMTKIYKTDTGGNVKSSFDTPGTQPCGLTWDGEHLWHTDTFEDYIHEIDENGSVISSFQFPHPVYDLAWDGSHLWVASSSTLEKKVYKIDTSGNVLIEYGAPSPNPYGLAWDGSHLWISDYETNKIYKTVPTTDFIETSAHDENLPLNEIIITATTIMAIISAALLFKRK